MMKDPRKQIELQFELGVNYIVMRPIVQACYQLEGHSAAISLVAYSVIDNLNSWLTNNAVPLSYPGMQTHIDKTTDDMLEAQTAWIAEGRYPPAHADMQPWARDFSREKWSEKAFNMIKPVIDYYRSKFCENDGALKKDMKRFKILRYANPLHMRNFAVGTVTLDKLSKAVSRLQWAPFDVDFARAMHQELKGYIQRCKDALPVLPDDVNPTMAMPRIEEFWRTNYIEFPTIASFVRYAYTSTTSSASVERVFSILKRTFNMAQMSCALEDYVETTIMLMFNKPFIKRFSHILQ